MNKNRVKAILLSVLVSLFALGGFFAPLASAVTDPGGIQQYLEIPLNFVRPAPTFKPGSGTGCLTPCKDVATGIGVYADVGSNHVIETANFSSVTAIDVTNGVPAPNDTSSVLTPNWAVVGGTLHVYNLTIGHKYKLYFIFDDAQSSDIQKFVSLTKSYCESTQLSQSSSVPASDQNAFNIVYHLQDGCARYNSVPFLPAAINPYIINGNQPVLYNTAQMTLLPQSLQAPTPANPSVVSANSTTSQPSDDCPLLSDSSLRWLGCPLIAIGASTVQTLQNLIQGFLYTPVNQIFDNAGFKASANSFRVLGMALIIIAALVMVISQAIGLELFDAYTIRKVLPRLVVALAGMALAWPILRFAVTFFDDLGLWSSSLIGAIPHVAKAGHDNGAAGTALAGAFAVVGGGAIAIVLGFGGILSLLGTIVLALLVGLVVLAVRQMVILLAVILAPLAIAAYVLPGTQKLWHFWRESFTTSLLMFPIIMAFLASGKALSTLLSASSNTSLQVLAIFVYFAPFILLPFAFKLAGGVMSTVFAMAHDRGRGGFDRLKKYRQGKAATNFDAMKRGNRFKSENFAANAFNKSTSSIAAVPHAGWNPRRMGSRMQAAMSQNSMREAAEFAEKDPNFGVIGQNDDFLNAGLHGKGSDSKVRSYLKGIKDNKGNQVYSDAAVEQGVAAIRAARRAAPAEVFENAAAMALPATGTAFKWRQAVDANGKGVVDANGDKVMVGGAGEMHDLINEVAGTDRVKAGRMLAAMRSGASQARRFDLAGGGFGSQIGVLEEQFAGSMTNTQATKRIIKESLEGQGGNYIAGSRKGAVEAFAPQIFENIQTIANAGDIKAFKRELAVVAGRYDAMSGSAPENARVLADEVLSKTVNGRRVQEWIEDNRTDPEFLAMRREYGASAARGGQAAYAAAQAAQQQAGGIVPPIVPPPVPPLGG